MFKSRSSRSNFLQDKFKTGKGTQPIAAPPTSEPDVTADFSGVVRMGNPSHASSGHSQKTHVVVRQTLDQLDSDITAWNDDFESWSKRWQNEIHAFNFENIRLSTMAVHKDKAVVHKTPIQRAQPMPSNPVISDAESIDSMQNDSIVMPWVSDYSGVFDEFSSEDKGTSSSINPHKGKGIYYPGERPASSSESSADPPRKPVSSAKTGPAKLTLPYKYPQNRTMVKN